MANELTENTNTNTQEQKPESATDTASLEARIKQLESDNAKLRQANTNASADASKWKKQYQDKLSDEEKAKAERDEQDAALRTELETLRKEKNIASYKSILVANDIGMDAEIAGTVAEALNSGEFDKVFDGIRKFIASHDKAMAEKAMLNNPKLPGGSSTKTVTREQFNNMGYREMLQFKTEHPDLYKEYTK